MKKLKQITSIALAAALLVTMLMSFTSCSTRLSGEYSSTDENNVVTTTYIFDGDKVTRCIEFSLASLSSQSTDETGEYDISLGGEITFVWDATGPNANKSEEERTETHSFQKTNTYIKIGDKYYAKSASGHSDHDGHNH